MRHARLRVTHVRGLSTTTGHRVPERKLIFPFRVWRWSRKRFSRASRRTFLTSPGLYIVYACCVGPTCCKKFMSSFRCSHDWTYWAIFYITRWKDQVKVFDELILSEDTFDSISTIRNNANVHSTWKSYRFLTLKVI